SPSEFSQYKLQGFAGEFAQAYPGLRIEFVSGAGKPHMLEDNIDVMIHIDEPQDSSFIAKKIAVATTNYYASPKYLAKHSEPQEPEDLHRHACIVELTHERLPRPWLFQEKNSLSKLRVKSKYACDSIQLCRTLAEQGLGVTMIPDFICEESLANGRLVKLFKGQYEVEHNLYAMYPSRRFVPVKIRAFLSFLNDYLPAKI
ncbi:MAG: substrate binding domain-containing protein, partial [Pseudomonadales bacterium]|nr:substrate binding domain-containing protein [Pseudomonadales bacterium]